uniref:DNA-directed RNA polymerase III subunit RPC9 n=1 Tax=Glycine max TaxID=3847 RepID=K7MSN5_SOYBN
MTFQSQSILTSFKWLDWAQNTLRVKNLEGNASALTNFEVLDFLRAKGASKDPTRVIAKVAQSEYKVYDYLVDTAASVQTRESINEFLTSVK